MTRSRYGITAAALIGPRGIVTRPLVVVEDGRILSAASQEECEVPANLRVIDFPEFTLAPGLIDIHIHGGAGRDVMDANSESLARIERHLAQTGVTSYLPTTVTAPVDDTLAALESLGAAVEAARQPGGDLRAQPLGVHLEGPFISTLKCGVHPQASIQSPSSELFDRMWYAAQGHISMATVAPEVPGASDLIAEMVLRHVCVSLGHTDSSLEPALRAILAGARHATHTFNAMRPLDHRDPGILGAVLTDSRLTADIIADGIHVHPEVVRMFLRAKGPEGAVLITDAISATGMGDGRYRLGPLEVEVQGERCLHDGKLAGSVLTLDRAIRNVMQFAGWSADEAVRLATVNPAKVAGVATRKDGSGNIVPWKGAIEAGADADILVINPQRSGDFQVVKTIARGAGIE